MKNGDQRDRLREGRSWNKHHAITQHTPTNYSVFKDNTVRRAHFNELEDIEDPQIIQTDVRDILQSELFGQRLLSLQEEFFKNCNKDVMKY